MGELMLHRGWRGGFPLEQVSTTSGMAPQRPKLQNRAEDGRTGSEVMEGMCPAHLASRHCPEQALGWWSYAFRECHRARSWGAVGRKDGSGWHNTWE
jgi:hypothetical protein